MVLPRRPATTCTVSASRLAVRLSRRDRPELDLVEIRQLAALGVDTPVVRIAGGDEPVVAAPLLEHERAGADRCLAELLAELLVGRRRGGPSDGAPEEVGERGVGLREVPDDGELVDDPGR